jgi:hypothetical protein
MKRAPSADGALFHFRSIIEIDPMPDVSFDRDALDRIHAAIVEASRLRPLTRLEIRIRCMTAPRPWRDAGVCSTTWYRRKKRARLAAQLAEAA